MATNPFNIDTINQIRHEKLGLSGNPLQVIYVEYHITDNDPRLKGKHAIFNKIRSATESVTHPTKYYICCFESAGLYFLELDFNECDFSGKGKFIGRNNINKIQLGSINNLTNKFTIDTNMQSATFEAPVHIGLVDQPHNIQQLKRLFTFTSNPKPVSNKSIGYMFCHRCGKKISADSTFCHYCGAKQQPEVTTSSNSTFYYDLRTLAPECSDADSVKAVTNYTEKMGFNALGSNYMIGKYKYTDYIYAFDSYGLVAMAVDYHEGSRYTSSYYSFDNNNKFIPKEQIKNVEFQQHLVKLYVYLNDDINPIKFIIPKIFKNADKELRNKFNKLVNN